MAITKSTLSKTTINEIQLGEPANPTVANRPHKNLETNIDDILSYLENDGAGSGMDADLLDGQQGAWYTDASNLNTGTLPGARFTDSSHGDRSGGALHAAVTTTSNGFMSAADKSKLNGIEAGATIPQTAAQIIAKLLTVDGSGSNLDADLLDGQQGAYYANITARLGYTPVNKAGDTMSSPLSGPAATSSGNYVTLGQGDGRYGRLGTTNTWTSVQTFNSNIVVPNAVTNSDAINLGQADGRYGRLGTTNTWTSAQTFNSNITIPAAASSGEAVNLGQFGSSMSSNGYQKLPNGLILQWGSYHQGDIAPGTLRTITLPISFPNACLNANVCVLTTSTSDAAVIYLDSLTKTQITFRFDEWASQRQYFYPYYFAIGY